MIVFGPIPSRRLGKSLGINNIPPKNCSYACVYCQLGRTNSMTIKRQSFYKPETIYSEVREKLDGLKKQGEIPDYLTFVPDGEPTLELNLEKEISLVKEFGIKVAVITNSSLIYMNEVREALYRADWVSLKVDAVSEDIWQKIDRPHRGLNLNEISKGIKEFSKNYRGQLVTETMVVSQINDDPKEMSKTAEYILGLNPKKAYILVPTRPPSEKNIKKPSEDKIFDIWNIYTSIGLDAEIIASYEGNAFSAAGSLRESILDIISVHPMREDAIMTLIEKEKGDKKILKELVFEGLASELIYDNQKFYLRNFKKK
jgi:wyosine [tRNA(Phe)-imidazoG37] synthetase (radical SAM superfamily)